MNEIKPCCLCGSEGKLFPHKIGILSEDGKSKSVTAWYVTCTNKKCEYEAIKFHKYKEDAIDYWNRGCKG
jgi:hypothetical protein